MKKEFLEKDCERFSFQYTSFFTLFYPHLIFSPSLIVFNRTYFHFIFLRIIFINPSTKRISRWFE